MTWLLTWALVLIVLWFLIEGFTRADKVYEFPFMAGAITFAFILPQLPTLVDNPFLPSGGYAKAIFMAILCLLMLRLGWALPVRPRRLFRWTFDEKKLLIVAAVLSVAGSYFYYKIREIPGELTISVQMTGLPVVYLFFARFLTYGLAIAALCFARRPSLASMAILGFDLLFYVDRVVISGRRAEAIELFMIFLLAFWFQRRWAAPRPLILVAMVLGSLALTSAGDYRDITKQSTGPDWSQITRIDLAANFTNLVEDGGYEMHNAIMRIDATDRSKQFDYGQFHWNRFIFNYVPRQVVGEPFKNSLMFSTPTAGRDYNPMDGTTETGLADAFASFWYFGALKFLLLAYLMVRIWRAAMSGEATAQIVYMLSIVPAMHAISHQTDWVVQVWIHMAIFLAPALALALVRKRSGPAFTPPGAQTAAT